MGSDKKERGIRYFANPYDNTQSLCLSISLVWYVGMWSNFKICSPTGFLFPSPASNPIISLISFKAATHSLLGKHQWRLVQHQWSEEVGCILPLHSDVFYLAWIYSTVPHHMDVFHITFNSESEGFNFARWGAGAGQGTIRWRICNIHLVYEGKNHFPRPLESKILVQPLLWWIPFRRRIQLTISPPPVIASARGLPRCARLPADSQTIHFKLTASTTDTTCPWNCENLCMILLLVWLL